MEDQSSKLNLKDCPEPLQRLIQKVAEDFQEGLIWPSVDELHLRLQEEGVTDSDFNAFGHQAFATHSVEGRQYRRLNLWAMYDTGRFKLPFEKAREVLDRAFEEIKESRRAVTVTRDDVARQLRRQGNDPYVAKVEYIFERSYFGYQLHPDHGWQLVVDVSRYRFPTPSIEDLLLSRPTRPSNVAATDALVARDVITTEASGLALPDDRSRMSRSAGTSSAEVIGPKKAIVFVSCGQVTADELKLGQDICALVNATPGLTAYFAQNVTSAEALSTNIFRNLKDASAVITVMHHRGTVTGRTGDPPRTRASVWIEQEIAIVAFQRAVEGRAIELAVFAQRGLSREGLRDNLILNPIEFDHEAEVLAHVREKLASWHLAPMRSPGPIVDLALRYAKQPGSDGETHVYELKVEMTNAGTNVVDDFDASLEFPEAFVLNKVGEIGIERTELAFEHYRVFRQGNVGRNRLLPGDRISIFALRYRVTRDIYWHQREAFSLPVTIKVYVSGALAGTVSKPFREIQNF